MAAVGATERAEITAAAVGVTAAAGTETAAVGATERAEITAAAVGVTAAERKWRRQR